MLSHQSSMIHTQLSTISSVASTCAKRPTRPMGWSTTRKVAATSSLNIEPGSTSSNPGGAA
eukprot:2301733-Prymnesium_polylepis.1